MTNSNSTPNVTKPVVDQPKSATAMPVPPVTKADVVTPANPATTSKP